ncbi:hypothetical protein N7497_008024 [Penicillium chrysogenum]|uniref:Transcription factor domain-containing protein n=1 Tax=Penicillium chrysogenum TaxID=5076 RepID=A0ABQ8WN57_PENCH|nr:hypothetical protein N7524_011913 [Penicillium chrysogenum]KAJ5271201.1 hypothetical protein N7505_006959 [Penicillium chrysogenum]KAJ6146042.1 hypothetical protein N7497_008024 [Penicillium chrysogenum]
MKGDWATNQVDATSANREKPTLSADLIDELDKSHTWQISTSATAGFPSGLTSLIGFILEIAFFNPPLTWLLLSYAGAVSHASPPASICVDMRSRIFLVKYMVATFAIDCTPEKILPDVMPSRVLLPSQQEATKPKGTPSPPSGNSPDKLLKARIPFLLRYYAANNTVLDLIPALEAGRPKVVHSSTPSSYLGETARGQLEATEGFLEGPGLDEPPFMWNSSIESGNCVITHGADTVPTNHQQSDILALRAQELARNLEPFATCTKSQANLKNAIDQDLFSAANIRLFERLYVQNHHRHCPIIHIPTFQAESATLPLLLATFLGGSLHSHPRDTCSLAVDCIDIAEAYMFSLPVFNTEIKHTAASESQSSENYDVLKAVVLLLQVQIGRNDPDIRRRVRYQRLPRLVHAARSISLFSSRHDRGSTTSEGWIWDAQSESRLR